MTKVDYLSKYFLDGTEPTVPALAALLRQDLAERSERIYEAVLSADAAPSRVALQSSSNSLRRSLGQISLNSKPVFDDDGQCFGGSHWFAALYLNLKKQHPEIPTQQLLIQIAKEFEEGVGIQAAFLQKFQGTPDVKALTDSLNLHKERHTEIDFRKESFHLALLEKIPELQDGVYYLAFSGAKPCPILGTEPLYGHGTVIIIENGNYYFFEPNKGLVGTGRDIGTDDKANDALYFLRLCHEYSPYASADKIFQRELEKLSTLFDANLVHIIREIAKEHRPKGRAHFGAFDVLGITKALEDRGSVFTQEAFGTLCIHLCIIPGSAQARLEMVEKGLRLSKFSLEESD